MSSAVVFAVIASVVVLLLWFAAAYNRLVRLRTQVQASWAQIDVQLRRRHSLIPNLVETVRGCASHERETLQAVITARQQAQHAGVQGPVDRAATEGALTAMLGRLFALAEAYPQLAANENFRALQDELGEAEDKIAYARQFYNTAVQGYNGAVQSIPTNLIAGVTGRRPEPYFEAVGDERADVQVRF
jgi:LemA protein